MSRFEVKTPRPDYTGSVAGIAFAKGRAVVTSDTAEGLAALYYFKTQGYGIAALDGVEIDAVLSRANESPAAEHARLTRENEELQQRLDIDKLREENARLSAEVFKVSKDEQGDADQGAQAGTVGGTQVELLPPPADSAGVGAWRKWAVDSGRATEDQAKQLDRAAIQAEHGAAYDAERAAQLKAAAAADQGVTA